VVGADRGLDALSYEGVDAVERGFGHERILGGGRRAPSPGTQLRTGRPSRAHADG
jgi:hypothetical protein